MTKLLLFDLDETLIHIWRGLAAERFEPEILIPIKHWKTGEVERWGMSIRPYVRECLEFANKHFEVGIFTASHQCFAEQVFDFIDPHKRLFHHRYYHQHTRTIEDGEDSFVVKDLNIFKGEVGLEDILIVDNNIYSFAWQLENGIPVLDFVGDPCDTELLKVRETLNHLKGFTNLPAECERTFRLREIYR
jgi:CTD small phosphatase-like protein 2